MHMARQETLVQLTADLVKALDNEAERRGVSRSALIREACESFLKESTEAAEVRRWIEGYERIPPGSTDDEAELFRAAAAEHRALLRRLDEEERRAGFGPWER